MYEKPSVSKRCSKKAVLLVVLCLTSSAEASPTNKLEGEVLMPLLSSSCPQPFASQTSANLWKEKDNLEQCWKECVQYSFVHKEVIFDNGDRQFRESNGLQTSCDKHLNGSYTCDLRSEEYSTAYVALAFNVIQPSSVSVRITRGNPENTQTTIIHRSGKVTTSVYAFGRQQNVRFSLTCMNNTRCLSGSTTAISIRYRCTRDIQTTC